MIEKRKRSTVSQMITLLERQQYRKLNEYALSSPELRRKRTRSLISLGGLVAKSGLLETFSLPLGADFQKDPEVKEQIAALFKGFLDLKDRVDSGEIHMGLYASQGLLALKKDQL